MKIPGSIWLTIGLVVQGVSAQFINQLDTNSRRKISASSPAAAALPYPVEEAKVSIQLFSNLRRPCFSRSWEIRCYI